VVFTANHLTVTDKQTIRKKLNINHKNTHINTIQIKENKHTAETKLPWFSRLLRHSARKQGGLILQRPRAPHRPPVPRELVPITITHKANIKARFNRISTVFRSRLKLLLSEQAAYIEHLQIGLPNNE